MNVDYRYIETYTGKLFHIENPVNIDIEDIAHSLSMQCRYTGHSSRFYSVAEHSVLVSYIVDSKFAKSALLHDASEAYISDISSPFKPLLENYKELEDRIMLSVADTFDLPPNFHEADAVKLADVQALKLEAFYLVPSKGAAFKGLEKVEWPDLYGEDYWQEDRDFGFPPEKAKQLFLDRWRGLKNCKL